CGAQDTDHTTVTARPDRVGASAVVPENLSAGFGDPGGGQRELARVRAQQQVDVLLAEQPEDVVFRPPRPARVVEDHEAERPAPSFLADGDSAGPLAVLGPKANRVQRFLPLASELAGDRHRDPGEDRRGTVQWPDPRSGTSEPAHFVLDKRVAG